MNSSQRSSESHGFHQLLADRRSLQLLLDTLACGILTIDGGGKIAYTNKSARRLLGKTRTELIGRPIESIGWQHPDGTPAADLPFAAALQHGIASSGRIFSTRDAEDRLIFLLNVVPLHDRRQQVCGAAADFIDITESFRFRQEREQLLGALQESESRYRLLAESAPVAVFECDGSGNWLYLNPHWTRISGLAPADSLGLGWTRAVHPDDLGRVLQIIRSPTGPELVETEYRLLPPSGGTAWVRMLRQAVVCDPASTRYVGTLAEITAQKDTERFLQRAKAAAEEANQAKSRFLQVVSHEIRTPMTVFMGMLELALAGPIAPEQRGYLQTAQSAADSLLMLVEDILLYAELEAGRLVLERVEFDLPACIAEAIDPAASEARRKGIDFRLEIAADVPQSMHGDPHRLRQVLLNIADNAVRFTDSGEIRIRVGLCRHCLRNGARGLRVAIHDTGLGISADQLDRLFQAFSQLDASTTRRFGGTGLGLAISKAIIEAMRGEIRVESAAGRGSVFSFVLPLNAGDTSFG